MKYENKEIKKIVKDLNTLITSIQSKEPELAQKAIELLKNIEIEIQELSELAETINPYLTIQEAARFMHVGRKSIDYLIRQNAFKITRLTPKKILIHKNDIINAMNSRTDYFNPNNEEDINKNNNLYTLQ